MAWILKKLCKIFGVETVKTVERISYHWNPKFSDADLYTVMGSIPLKWWFNHCKEEQALNVALAKTEKDRSEEALILKGMTLIEIRCSEYFAAKEKKEEKTDTMDQFGLGEEQLIKEADQYDKLQEKGGTVYND